VYGTPQDEAQALKKEAAYLQSEMEALQRRLAELESA
jgi:prefoldin subunit 5